MDICDNYHPPLCAAYIHSHVHTHAYLLINACVYPRPGELCLNVFSHGLEWVSETWNAVDSVIVVFSAMAVFLSVGAPQIKMVTYLYASPALRSMCLQCCYAVAHTSGAPQIKRVTHRQNAIINV